MPELARILVIFALVYAVLVVFRMRRRGIMRDRKSHAKKFKATPEDIIEIKYPTSE